MTVEPRRHERFAGLSCYTANLAGYLDTEMSDVDSHVARSVRLAVRLEGDRLQFSHHRYPLDLMPDGTRLRYATLPPRAALVSLIGELSRQGRVLVVTDGSRLPWSPSRQQGAIAPHWLLVTGRSGDSWHVVDSFAGLLPAGEQRPYVGWLSTAQLTDAMVLPAGWSAEQHTRNSLAFGFPVPVPVPVGPLWLRRVAGAPAPGALDDGWLVGAEHVLPFLADHLADSPQMAERHLDDLWAAAAHRVFRYRWLAARSTEPEQGYTEAVSAWTQLPSALRFAVDSARRGRARPTLLRQTFRHLLEIEPTEDQILTASRREAR
ncbi:hypothetical protein [Actinocrispum wychmicini]|uniref:Uncharacterized protein n=1 Tax=Actinocrispum wychmicini TaxID=1213861 RepID=A0A4R2JN19_9PSEU|nr:hypothetical protein [Actinocrispum wychmicini]TCO60704.1 hypothetical protein EV192_103279 [Actinocrispum wychmicini]